MGEKLLAPEFWKPNQRKLNANLVGGKMNTNSINMPNTLKTQKLTEAFPFDMKVRGTGA